MSDSAPNILVIDTATDVCSVALGRAGDIRFISENIPRQHSQRLFGMLRELLPDGKLNQQGVDLIAYSHGPGSFTGLRIAASAVQGLAYANDLPVAGISTLEVIAEGLCRRQQVKEGESFLVLLDARINEVYWAEFKCMDGHASRCSEDAVAPPDQVAGSELVDQRFDDALPEAEDLVYLAEQAWLQQDTHTAEQIAPVYVRDEIGWKKLAEQGPK